MNKLWKTGKSTATLILAHSFALLLPDPGLINNIAVKQTRKSGTHSNNQTLINPYSRGKPRSLISGFCERNACRFFFRGLLFYPGEQMAGCTVF